MANLSNTLFAIVKAIQLKAKQLGIVLLFTYLIVYLFSWLAFYIFADDFVYYDVKNINSGEQISESFCYSSIQCWMTVVNYGIRSGGGIADALHKSSFRTNQKYYVQRFLFDISFHLFVVLCTYSLRTCPHNPLRIRSMFLYSAVMIMFIISTMSAAFTTPSPLTSAAAFLLLAPPFTLILNSMSFR